MYYLTYTKANGTTMKLARNQYQLPLCIERITNEGGKLVSIEVA